MARNSLAAAKAELFALLAANTTTGTPATAISSYVSKVYDHEPKVGAQTKNSATISTAGMTPDFYVLAVRGYFDAGADAKKAQDNVDAFILACDGLVSAGFGPSNWTVEYHVELEAFVAENLLQAGRQDNF